MVGLGILKDIPGHSDSLCDIIPVDYVARQVLVSLAFASSEAKKTKGFLMISHCTLCTAHCDVENISRILKSKTKTPTKRERVLPP